MNSNTVSSRRRAGGSKPADDPDLERMLLAAEEGLRRLGFTERTIRDKRRATRAQLKAYLEKQR